MKNKYLNIAIKVFVQMLAAFIYAFFFKVIVEGRNFLAMGSSGISVILSRVIGISLKREELISILYMIFYILINIPTLILGYTKISKKFIFYTMIFVITFSLTVGFVPATLATSLGFNQLDNLTSAILIGLISGAACASSLMAGGCSGGLDVVTTYLNVKKGKSIGVYNFIVNALILTIGLFVFKDIPSIIYTLVYAFFSSLILDHYYNRNKKILLEIVTTKKEEVCSFLLEHSHHGCTIIPAIGAYTKDDKYVIHTAISRFQLRMMTKSIMEIDPNCFIIDLSVYNVNGMFYMPPIK